jgi:hypothetical protein
MAVPIIPRIERGRLYFQTADVCSLPSLRPLAPGPQPKLTDSMSLSRSSRSRAASFRVIAVMIASYN